MTAATWNRSLRDAHPPRERRRRGGFWILLAAALVVGGSSASILRDDVESRDFFPLEAVRFDGDLGNVREADLRSAVAPHMGSGLFGIDVRAIRHSVERLPWVAGASVRRVWPNAVRITVREQVPVARWGDAALLNTDAGVFEPERRPEDLPRLDGPPGSAPEVLTRFRALRERLRPLGFRIRGLELDDRRSWSVLLRDGGRIVLGREEQESRLERLQGAWPRISTVDRMPALIDLRYPNGFSVHWQAEETGDTNAPKD